MPLIKLSESWFLGQKQRNSVRKTPEKCWFCCFTRWNSWNRANLKKNVDLPPFSPKLILKSWKWAKIGLIQAKKLASLRHHFGITSKVVYWVFQSAAECRWKSDAQCRRGIKEFEAWTGYFRLHRFPVYLAIQDSIKTYFSPLTCFQKNRSKIP